MASHPLDIGKILRSNGVDVNDSKRPSKGTKPKAQQASFQPKSSQAKTSRPKPPQVKTAEGEVEQIRIRKEFWDQLNEESRRMLTSRIWRGVDFNPMLSELEDLSKLSEKWLKWAVPTYVNGLKGGPIKQWFEGVREARDFHYVLVGEHLIHLKTMRQQKKAEEEAVVEEAVSEEVVSEKVDAEALVESDASVATEPQAGVETSSDQQTVDLAEAVSQAFDEYVVEKTSAESVKDQSASVPTPVSENSENVVEEHSVDASEEKEEFESSQEPLPIANIQAEVAPVANEADRERLHASLKDLDHHIAWFQSYIEKNKN
jgi:hypothetical protein